MGIPATYQTTNDDDQLEIAETKYNEKEGRRGKKKD